LIFDGRCGFCRIWMEYWKKLTGDQVDYAPSQEVAARFPHIPPEAFAQAVQLIRADGSVVSGARAVFETLGRERLYESSRLLASVSEASYRFIARHRDLFYWLTRLTFGTQIEPARFADTQRLFLRTLAVIYAIAFGSLGTQIVGLVGAQGIAPVHDYLQRIAAAFGPIRYLSLPTVFWLNPGDLPLRVLAWAGVALAALLLLDRLERFILLLLYVLYLSFNMAGQEFLSFQWDSLLLEVGFLAIFFGRSVSGQRVIAWLYRCMAFRLYFLSGYVKLGSHDPTWANLTALQYHFHTQPLPNIIAWYADKLPDWFQRGSTGAVLGIELLAPFLIFGPRRWRHFGAGLLLGLQALIFLTGNYTFFNLLAAAITLFLFDDQAISGLARKLWVPAIPQIPSTKRARMALAALAAVILTLGALHLFDSIEGFAPEPLETLGRLTAPFQVVNSYGLFAVMTTMRPEIVIEGSNDGDNWKPYEFRFKPGNLDRAPRWIEPFQPRLDWQMWFAALNNVQTTPWFPSLMVRLLQGSPAVLGLFETNPFPEHPPRSIRALLYDYSFTDRATRRRTGQWWERRPAGIYLQPVALKPSVSYSN
jgi:predicted DCC family thiol-disulfide oxidoreductase YuxK